MSHPPLLDILMITYNRAAYTERSLQALLDSCDETMRVWVWHNGNDAATLDVVRRLRTHPRFHHLHVSPENKRLREPTNWFWQHSDAPFVSKVDDDCLLPNGWAQPLLRAHFDNPQLGAIACWRYFDGDYQPEIARRKIAALAGGHQLMRNCWVQGSGYVLKRACLHRQGLLRNKESFPSYCIRAAVAGWEHGWYYPFIQEEHMDDPRSVHCLIRTEAAFRANRPLGAKNYGVHTVEEWQSKQRYMAIEVQLADPDPRAYTGWRGTWKRVGRRTRKLLRLPEPWRHRPQAA